MKTYAILVSIIVFGLILSLIATACPEGLWTRSWLIQMAAVLVIGGGLGIIDKTFLHHGHNQEIRELFSIHESTVSLGLRKIYRDANQYSYISIIRESPSLSIVCNDGRTWVSGHITDIKARFLQKKFDTEFFVPNPDGDFIKILAKKTGYTEQEQIDKINQAKTRLIEEYRNAGKNGSLLIYHIPYFPTHSIFLGSEEALVSFYGVSTGRRSVPLFSYRRLSDPECLFADIKDDVEKLKQESICVFDSAKDVSGQTEDDKTII